MKGKGMPSGNAHMYRQLNGRRLLTGMVLAILTLGLIVVDLGMGSSGIGPGEVVDALLGGPDGDTANTAILWSIRLPMTLTCVFVGGSLSLAGLQIQTITNNALASPYTLGITASASFIRWGFPWRGTSGSGRRCSHSYSRLPSPSSFSIWGA